MTGFGCNFNSIDITIWFIFKVISSYTLTTNKNETEFYKNHVWKCAKNDNKSLEFFLFQRLKYSILKESL